MRCKKDLIDVEEVVVNNVIKTLYRGERRLN